MQYGFDKSGGFFAIDHYACVAAYAYATSPRADKAKRRPELVARRMLADAYKVNESFPGLSRKHYETISDNSRGL